MSFQRGCTNSLLRVCYANIDCTGTVQKQECSLHGYASPSSPYPDDSFAVIYTPRINPIYTSNSFPIQRIPLFPPPLSPFQNFPFESKIDQPIQEQQNIAPPLILSLNDSCCFLHSSCPWFERRERGWKSGGGATYPDMYTLYPSAGADDVSTRVV